MAALETLPVAAAPAPSALTLYRMEEHLAALAEATEVVPQEQEAAFLADFQAALTAAVEKRDRVGQFLAHLESQVALAKSEIARLQERKQTYERVLDRLEEYVIATIEKLAPMPRASTPS